MLMIGANAGIIGMTKEHLGLALALHKPVFVVITKIDMCPPNVLASTLKLLQKILKSPGCKKIPLLVKNEDDVRPPPIASPLSPFAIGVLFGLPLLAFQRPGVSKMRAHSHTPHTYLQVPCVCFGHVCAGH
jgi:hypothetical protein